MSGATAVEPMNREPGHAPRCWRGPAVQRHRVLVAVDDVEAQQDLLQMLDELGWDVQLAYNGFVALQMALEQRPRLALLDEALPWMSGMQVCSQLQRRCLPVWTVLLTASLNAPERAHASGATSHLLKPIRGLEVVRELQRVLSASSVAHP